MKFAFLSHSSPDDRYVQEMVQYLHKLGYEKVFNDSHSIEPDAEFWPAIERGIRECDAFVVVLSHASVKSTWVDREVQFARQLGKNVIPVRIEDCKLPAGFSARDVVELRQGRGDKIKLAPSRILRHSPPILFGREEWLDALDAAWAASGRVHVYSLIAWGGAGKTSVVAHWVANRLAAKAWPGVERYFDWSFYSQGTRELSQSTADFFIAAALKFFDDPDPQAGSPWERGTRLARLVREHRTLLVLDGIEPLQYPPNSPQAGEFKDDALAALLQGLAMENPGLCIVTSREPLKTLQSFIPGGTAEEQHLSKLPKAAAIALLRHLQISGTEEELEEAWKDVGGHALTLQLLGRFLADAHGGDIRLRREIHFTEADRETPGRTAMKVLLSYEKWLESAGPERQRDLAVLRLTGLFDRPATPDCLSVLRAAPAIPGLTDAIVPLTDVQWRLALKGLERLELITLEETDKNIFVIEAHPLVREYFSNQIRSHNERAFCAAHSRLFDLLVNTVPGQPESLEGLQPLYQAVTHGCLAGRYEEARAKVYRDRILRGTGKFGNFSMNRLGASGADLCALAAFFLQPWTEMAPNLEQREQGWLLNQVSQRLIALGRLNEALKPAQQALELAECRNDLNDAITRAVNLCHLEVLLGHLTESIASGRRAMMLSDRAMSDWKNYIRARVGFADALHMTGQRESADEFFAMAEETQAEHEGYPRLYALRGFRYSELDLATAERAAWSITIRHPGEYSPQQTDELTSVFANRREQLRNCSEVARRAGEMHSRMAGKYTLLETGLDHIRLARALLYRAIITSTIPETLPQAVDRQLSALREAKTLHILPLGLLTSAFYAGTLGREPDESRRLLDEAQLIAERGPMPLYLADVHLHRARLFREKTELIKARALIDKHGYHRRDEELRDTEAAIVRW